MGEWGKAMYNTYERLKDNSSKQNELNTFSFCLSSVTKYSILVEGNREKYQKAGDVTFLGLWRQ